MSSLHFSSRYLYFIPDFVGGTGVSPSALDLVEPADRLLLPGHGAAGRVGERRGRLRVHREVEEQRHSLPEGK